MAGIGLLDNSSIRIDGAFFGVGNVFYLFWLLVTVYKKKRYRFLNVVVFVEEGEDFGCVDVALELKIFNYGNHTAWAEFFIDDWSLIFNHCSNEFE